MAIHEHSYEGAYHAQVDVSGGTAQVILQHGPSGRSICLPLGILLMLVGNLITDIGVDVEG